MDIYLKRAILHMMDRDSGAPVFSSVPLDISKEYIWNYVTKKISKISSATTKTGTITHESKFGKLLSDLSKENFVEKSQGLVEYWAHFYTQSEDAPSSDVLIALYELENQPHLAFMKLNYKESYTHFVEATDEEIENKLILNRAILPAPSSKPDEAVDVNLETLGYELLEKRFEFSGEKHYYFSEYIIESEPAPSIDQSVREVKKLAKSISKKYDEDEYEVLANVQEAVYESIEEFGVINNEVIAEKVFSDNISAKLEYKDEISEKIPNNIAPVQEAREISEKKFGKQKLKMSNGIELIVPMDVYKNANLIEFVNNPDGTVSILIKNIEEIVNKL